MYTFQIKKHKGKFIVIRKWDKDTFPLHPVKDVDFK